MSTGSHPVLSPAGGAGLIVFALGQLFPPDVYPELTPIYLCLVGLAVLVSRSESCAPGIEHAGAWLAFAVVSLAWTLSPGGGLHAISAWLVALGLYILLAEVSLPVGVSVVAILAAVHGGFATWQGLVSLPMLANEVSGVDDSWASLVHQRAMGGRAFSRLLLPGHLGAVLAAFIPVLISEWPSGRARRALSVAGIIGCVAGLFASRSLGGVLALLVVGVAWVVMRHGERGARRAGWRLAAVGLALLIVAAVPRLHDLLDAQSHENPVVTRVRLWQRAVEVIQTSPVVGMGIGAYPSAWLRYANDGDVPAQHAHMSYLEIAADTGLFGLGLLLLFASESLRATRHTGARLGAVTLMLHAGFDFDLQSPALLMTLAALLGVSTVATESGRAPRSIFAVGALVMVFASSDAVAWRVSTVLFDDTRAGVHGPFDVRGRADEVMASAFEGSTERGEALAVIERLRELEPSAAWLAAQEAQLLERQGLYLGSYLALCDAARAYPARVTYQQRAELSGRRLEDEWQRQRP